MKKSAKRVDAAINNTGIRKSSVKADASDTVPIMWHPQKQNQEANEEKSRRDTEISAAAEGEEWDGL